MTLNIRAEIARVPDMGDVFNIAGGFLNNLTKAVVHIANNTLMQHSLNNSNSSSNSNSSNISTNNDAITTNIFTSTIPLIPTISATAAAAINAAASTSSSLANKSATTSILSTTALQWLQHHPDSQLPATMKITDISNAFLANLTHMSNANVYIPATAGPAIEDDEIRLEHAPQLSKSAMIKVYVLSIMALFSLLGNILTMWNIYKTRLARRNSRHSWSAIYSLIFHLSIADVLVTGFCIIGEAAWCYTVKWLANDITCKLVKLFQMFSLYLSTYVLVLIGVDRWIAVKYPMKSLNMAKRCYRLLGGTYILSLLLSLPQFFIFRVARGPFIEEFYQCVTHGFYTAEWQEQLYATFTLVMTFLLPLCILFGTYMSTFRTISSSEKMFQGSKLASYTNKPTGQTNRQRLIHKAKMKSLRISVVIIFAFLICWTPYNVMMLIFMFWNPDKRFGEDLQSAIFFFGMSNSLVNPLIYGAFHLCPMKRKASKKSNNNNGTYSLNRYTFRGDSQRTPSMLTAVTQVDGNGRQVRNYRQSSYYRSVSTTGSTYKENIGLLQTSTATTVTATLATPTLLRKSASMKSPHPNQRSIIYDGGGVGHKSSLKEILHKKKQKPPQKYHNHSSEIIQNDSSVSSNSGGSGAADALNINDPNEEGISLVLSYDNQRGGGVGGVASMKMCNSSNNSASLGNGKNSNDLTSSQQSATNIQSSGLQTLLSGIEDCVSSV